MGRRRYRQRESQDDGLAVMMLDVALRSSLGGGLTVVFLVIVGFLVIAATPEPLRSAAPIISIVIFGFAGVIALVTMAGMIKRAVSPGGRGDSARPDAAPRNRRYPARRRASSADSSAPIALKDNSPAPMRPAASRLRCDSLLSPGERAFYDPLRDIVGERYTIQIKPSLADVLQCRSDPRWQQIAAMHIDFLLCDPRTLHPRLAIELDDRSHRSPRRADTDRYKAELLAGSGIPLLRQRCEQAYDIQGLREAVESAIGS